MYSKNTGHFSTVCFQHKVCLEVTAGSSLSSKDNDREFEDFFIILDCLVLYCLLLLCHLLRDTLYIHYNCI